MQTVFILLLTLSREHSGQFQTHYESVLSYLAFTSYFLPFSSGEAIALLSSCLWFPALCFVAWPAGIAVSSAAPFNRHSRVSLISWWSKTFHLQLWSSVSPFNKDKIISLGTLSACPLSYCVLCHNRELWGKYTTVINLSGSTDIINNAKVAQVAYEQQLCPKSEIQPLHCYLLLFKACQISG